jgi:hypothetical protein
VTTNGNIEVFATTESQPREQSSARPRPPLSVLQPNGPCRDQALILIRGAYRGSRSPTTVAQCQPAGRPPQTTEGVEPTFGAAHTFSACTSNNQAALPPGASPAPLSGACRGKPRCGLPSRRAVRRVVLRGLCLPAFTRPLSARGHGLHASRAYAGAPKRSPTLGLQKTA